MLKKLLKYDLKYLFKVLIIFYSLSIFFALLTRIFLNIDNSFIINIIGKICSGVTISMIFNILINNLMRLWARFKNNFYKDESYLTHTLPISKSILYLSKVLTSIITIFISICVIGITLFIAYYSKENVEILKGLILPILEIYNSTFIVFLLVILFILFLEFLNALQMGFTGIILGHKMNNNKTLYSVLFGFVSYIISQIFILICLFIYGLFNNDIMNLFYTTSIVSVDIIKQIVLLASISYIVVVIIVYFINNITNKNVINVLLYISKIGSIKPFNISTFSLE